MSVLKAVGFNITAPTRPLQKPSSFLNLYLLLKGLLLHPRLPHNPWKFFFLERASGDPDSVGHLFFNPQENDRLKQKAKNEGLNLGFYILTRLDSIIKKELYKNPQDESTWLCPVDVRGAYPQAPLLHNFVSFVVTKLQGTSDPQSVRKSYSQYRADLKQTNNSPF